MRLLIPPAIVVAAWLISSRYPEGARKASRLLGVILAMVLVAIAATGVERLENPDSIHRWFGHGSMIAVWLAASFAIGVILQQRIRQRPILAICQSFMILAAVGLNLEGEVTGYMGPSSVWEVAEIDPRILEESTNRFYVLHTVVLPCLFLAFLGVWIAIFRPEIKSKENTEKT